MLRSMLVATLMGMLTYACAPTDLHAEIRRTEYGIPHITADDWMSLGYGFGYAYAEDNFCIVMREIVSATSRSTEFLGLEDGNLQTDLLYRYLNGTKAEFEEEFLPLIDDRDLELADGFTRGLNRYLAETGVENLPTGERGCRDASWVYPVDTTDLLMFMRRQAIAGSSDQGIFRKALLDVVDPWSSFGGAAAGANASAEATNRSNLSSASSSSLDPAAEAELAAALADAAEELRPTDRGSNALAVGSDASQTGKGLLLGNPHQPWFGSGAWYQAHLTIPGEYDVAGASLHGFPFIGIGFNQDLAWTHTISFANRFSLYELTLNPNNPYQYLYDGEYRDIVPTEVTVDVLLEDGSMGTESYTFWETHFGPIANLKGVSEFLDGWPMLTGTVLAFRDANLYTGIGGFGQWLTKAQATDIDGYVEAVGAIGNPLFHELAVDRDGEAFYGQLSAVPFISQNQLDTCITGPISKILAAETTNVVVSLDGSDPACEWGVDPEAPEGTNLYGPSHLPQLRTQDYVANSNNSYWLTNPDQPLEGFPSVMGPLGPENGQQFLRTRIGHIMVEERKQATDGLSPQPLFDLETLKSFMYRNDVHAADLVLDDVIALCQYGLGLGSPEACSVLEHWDRDANVDSRGTQVFVEFWNHIRRTFPNRFQAVVDNDEFWKIDFDPNDPVNTPSGIDLSVAANHELVAEALAEATKRLTDAGVSLDARWGDTQFREIEGPSGTERIPIHGGPGMNGIYGAISAGLGDGGYINPRAGNSYIQAVTFDDSPCPIADVILIPSQSTDPDSPHYADQTRLYAEKQWIRFPYCSDDVEAAQIGDTVMLTEPR